MKNNLKHKPVFGKRGLDLGSRKSEVGQRPVLHVYTGDGKGKTTAAFGLALRTLGAGKKVAIIQFCKKANTSEFKAIKKYRLPILIETFGIGFYGILNDHKPKTAHIKASVEALERTQQILSLKKYDLIILDEINVAMSFGFIKVDEVIKILQDTPSHSSKRIDIVFTGRDAPLKIIKIADLVTNFKNDKNYFDQGIKAHRGIEF